MAAESSLPKPVNFEGVTPVLRVNSVDASVGYYERALGFKKQWGQGGFACVARGRCSLFLSEGDQGHTGGWVWIGVEDVEALREEYRRTGAKVRHEPTNYPWALEMQVEDPDGNVLRMGSDSREGEPTGEWLDMNGVRWAPVGEGKWKKVD